MICLRTFFMYCDAVKKIVCLSILLVLSACTSIFKNPTSVKYFDATSVEQGEATVFFSAGAPSGCFSRLISLNIRDAVTNKAEASPYEATSYQNKSDFETHQGFLHAIKLKPGNYYFYPYDWSATVISAHKASFSVKPNETVYLGELFFVAKCSSIYEINDKFDRDMNRIKELNPALDTSNVVKRIMVLDKEPS